MIRRIACDVDGTLADMSSAVQLEAIRLFGGKSRGPGLPEQESPEAPRDLMPALTSREYRQLWTHLRSVENFWDSLKEIEPGAVARFAAAAARHRWEVIFLTQRPSTAGELAQIQTQRWLERQGFERPSVFVVNGSRGKIAAALELDAVLDDRPENCLDVATDSNARAFLVWRDPPRTAPPGAARMRIETVFSFEAVLARLEALSTRSAVRRGSVARIRQAFGV